MAMGWGSRSAPTGLTTLISSERPSSLSQSQAARSANTLDFLYGVTVLCDGSVQSSSVKGLPLTCSGPG